MKWDDIPTAAKMPTSIVIVIMSLLAYMSTYQTKAEAQSYQNENAQQLVLFRVQQIETVIAGYRYRLLSEKLSDEQREWLKDEIDRLEREIKCIQEGKC